MKPYKYPGELGRPSKNEFPNILNALHPDYSARLAEDSRRSGVFALLFAHYGIDVKSELRWEDLAAQLAFNHVPAMGNAERRKVGRPRKIQYREPAKRGRPPDRERRQVLRYLLQMITDLAKENGYRGHGVVTKSLRLFLLQEARANNRTPDRHVSLWLPHMCKLVSEAKVLFPEIAEKLPK